MKKNGLGHKQEDRGVEARVEEIWVAGKRIRRETPAAVDGLGRPAEPEDDLGSD